MFHTRKIYVILVIVHNYIFLNKTKLKPEYSKRAIWGPPKSTHTNTQAKWRPVYFAFPRWSATEPPAAAATTAVHS